MVNSASFSLFEPLWACVVSSPKPAVSWVQICEQQTLLMPEPSVRRLCVYSCFLKRDIISGLLQMDSKRSVSASVSGNFTQSAQSVVKSRGNQLCVPVTSLKPDQQSSRTQSSFMEKWLSSAEWNTLTFFLSLFFSASLLSWSHMTGAGWEVREAEQIWLCNSAKPSNRATNNLCGKRAQHFQRIQDLMKTFIACGIRVFLFKINIFAQRVSLRLSAEA